MFVVLRLLYSAMFVTLMSMLVACRFVSVVGGMLWCFRWCFNWLLFKYLFGVGFSLRTEFVYLVVEFVQVDCCLFWVRLSSRLRFEG